MRARRTLQRVVSGAWQRDRAARRLSFMQLRNLVFGSVAVIALVAVRGAGNSHPAKQPAPTVRSVKVPALQMPAPRAAAIEVVVDDELHVDEVSDVDHDVEREVVAIFEDEAEIDRALEASLAASEGERIGAIRGRVDDEETGEPLAGVTISASSPTDDRVHTVITDDNGRYVISGIPPGSYLVTFYYLDYTREYSDVFVATSKVTPLFTQVDGERIDIASYDHGHGITIDTTYIRNIPVPGRVFESALGVATGDDTDAVGVSFSGTTTLDNHYYIDGVMVDEE
jgi:hypothetical protein